MSDMILPAITLMQPWASWIMRGWKDCETRTHSRFKRLKNKTILIHAGLSTDKDDVAVRNPYLTRKQLTLNPDEIVNGFILGSAYVYDVGWLTDFSSKRSLIDCGNTHRFGLFLEDIEPFDELIPCKGDLGIWYYDLNKKQKVKKPSSQYLLYEKRN